MAGKLKVTIVCGMVLLGGISARAQDSTVGAGVGDNTTVGAGVGDNSTVGSGVAADNTVGSGVAAENTGGSGVRARSTVSADDDLDFPLLPVDTGVNGVTDRFGMPIPGRPIKGPSAGAPPVRDSENASSETPKRGAVSRTKGTLKRSASKTKDAKKPGRAGIASTGAAPQYYVPRGSINWSPGNDAIVTSPSDPYGYGYGNAGYGTEVFGDFWKGWPMVQ